MEVSKQLILHISCGSLAVDPTRYVMAYRAICGEVTCLQMKGFDHDRRLRAKATVWGKPL